MSSSGSASKSKAGRMTKLSDKRKKEGESKIKLSHAQEK